MTPQKIIRKKMLEMLEELKFLRYFYSQANYAMEFDAYIWIANDYIGEGGELPLEYEYLLGKE